VSPPILGESKRGYIYWQTTSEISPLHQSHKYLCDRFRSKWQFFVTSSGVERSHCQTSI